MSIAEVLAIAMFLAFMGMVFTGFPVAWSLGGLAVLVTALSVVLDTWFGVGIGLDWSFAALTVERVWDVMQNWVLVALPMFVFMGLVLDHSGVAEDLLHNMAALFGRVRGGLAVTVTLIGILLAASTGIVGASVVLLTVLGMPIMLAQGYDRGFASGTVAAAGTLGILIPPSIMLVLMADRLAMPVGDLFMGALVPGMMLGGLYVLYVLGVAALDPRKAPLPEHAQPLNWALIGSVLRAIVAPLALILAVLGSIFAGIATPTEAAGVGAAGALLLAWGHGRLNWSMVSDALHQTTRTTGFIFAIFLGATAFSLVLRGLGGDALIERSLTGLPFGPDGVVITILLVTFLLGFFLDWIEITLIVLPLVGPVVEAMGFDLVWFTILFALCLQTSFLTPPVGFSLFYMRGAAPAPIPVGEVYRGVLPFIFVQVLGIIMVYVWPALATWLPTQAYGP